MENTNGKDTENAKKSDQLKFQKQETTAAKKVTNISLVKDAF